MAFEEIEAADSIPSQSPSQSLVKKPMPDHPETWYCIGIELTLTKENGAVQPPSHTWQATMIEDMVWEAKSGLTKAVVTGPGRAVLFYGRQSQGEGLNLGEVRDAAFTLSGAISWVGKLSHLHTIPMSLWEGWWVIVQASTECWIELRGTGCPHSHPVTPQPFRFYQREDSSQPEEGFHSANEHIEEPAPVCQLSHHRPQWDWGHGPQHLDQWLIWPQACLPSPDWGSKSDQSSVSMAYSVSSRSVWSKGHWHPHHGWCTGKSVAIWRSTYWSSKMKTQRTWSPTKVGDGTWQCIIVQDAKTVPFFPMPSVPYKDTLVSWWEVQGWTLLWTMYSP